MELEIYVLDLYKSLINSWTLSCDPCVGVPLHTSQISDSKIPREVQIKFTRGFSIHEIEVTIRNLKLHMYNQVHILDSQQRQVFDK